MFADTFLLVCLSVYFFLLISRLKYAKAGSRVLTYSDTKKTEAGLRF